MSNLEIHPMVFQCFMLLVLMPSLISFCEIRPYCKKLMMWRSRNKKLKKKLRGSWLSTKTTQQLR